MIYKKHILLIVIFAIILFSACSNKKPGKPNKPDLKTLLASALSNKIFSEVEVLRPQVRVTENTANLIGLFSDIHSENLWTVDRQVEYIKQFLPDMQISHQAVLNEIMIWLYVSQIYRHEVSPPIRIIQREELYLEPSKIDFTKCSNVNVGVDVGVDVNVDCAHEVRKKSLSLISNEELTAKLKKMALKDPCVNLSSQLQGQIIANRCLKKSKGQLKILLLSLPSFSINQWLQIISAEN
ncbi:MAG: hypothetical protein L3J83_03245 [Proteobacteria bacterium]|nr:hypothetical protein [Pseudomonadota bacterium]